MIDPQNPQRPSSDQIARNVAAMKSQGAPDEDVEAYLQSIGIQPQGAAPAPSPLQAEYRSGALSRRMASENANDAAAAAPSLYEKAAAHAANVAQGIPGMERLEAYVGQGAGALSGHPMSYDESLNSLRSATGQIGGVTRFAEKALGGLPLMAVLPGNPAVSGAVLGGADQALGADNESLGERGVRTVAGAALGHVLGSATDHAATALTSQFAPKLGAGMYSILDQRAADAAARYQRALSEGQGLTKTPAIEQFLAQPAVQEIVTGLQGMKRFAGMDAHDPHMLDAIYKVLSDQAGTLKTKLGSALAARTSANLGRYSLEDVQGMQKDLLDAMNGPMPSYQTAVHGYADASRDLTAYKQGARQLPRAGGAAPEVVRGVKRLSPEGFARWVAQQPDAAQDAAQEGVLAGVNSIGKYRASRFRPLGFPMGFAATDALKRAPGLLRSIDPDAPNYANAALAATHTLPTSLFSFFNQ